ncbi:GspH/FimT family protein [soil metagenome]
MVVLAIVAILTTLAVPSFMRLVQTNTMSSNVNTFMADLRYARSESMRRGGGVVMCRSDNPEAASPVCKTTSGPGANGWVSGWIVFLDMNNDVDKDPGELLLRMQSSLSRMDSITESGGASTKFRFTATGRLFDVSSATSLQFGGSEYAGDVQRVLCVSPGGRARIAGNGDTSCGSDS